MNFNFNYFNILWNHLRTCYFIYAWHVTYRCMNIRNFKFINQHLQNPFPLNTFSRTQTASLSALHLYISCLNVAPATHDLVLSRHQFICHAISIMAVMSTVVFHTPCAGRGLFFTNLRVETEPSQLPHAPQMRHKIPAY